MPRFAYFVRETWISLRRNLLMTLAGIITVAVSLTLFGGIRLIQTMVDHGTSQWKDGVELEIFMNVDAPQQQIDDVRIGLDELVDSGQVKRYKFLSKEDAYNEFQRIFHDQPALVESTTPEALPTSFRVAPAEAELTEEINQMFTARPGVDEVLTAQEQIDRIIEVTRYIRYAFWFMAGALFASALFLIVNTIRLATFARRREIEVMKLVGASNWFVRIPFMAEGLVQGAIGAGPRGRLHLRPEVSALALRREPRLRTLAGLLPAALGRPLDRPVGAGDRCRHRHDRLPHRPPPLPRRVISGRTRCGAGYPPGRC